MNKVLKKITALFLAVLLGTVCFAGALPASADEGIEINNEVNFPDAVFRSALANKEIDKDENGFLSPEELSVEELYISGLVQKGQKIADLRGIEYFTACRSLHITNLGIEKLDLSALKNLQKLYAHGTGNKFSSLDLTQNTALEFVSVWGNKSLKTLVLPASVKEVQCQNCSIANLDLQNLENLEMLSCYSNELTSLDVTANKKLTLLNCSHNHIAELDLGPNSALVSNASDYYLGSQTLTAQADFDGEKNILVPVSIVYPSRITETNMFEDGSFRYERDAFVFADYSVLENGIDYTYYVNLEGAEDMSVHIDVSKNFYKVTYLDSEDGDEMEYQLVTAGGSAIPPELPEMPDGMVCGHYSQTAENVQSDLTVYVVWQAEHTEAVTAFADNIATISCSSCGTAPRMVAFADCLNLTSSDAGFEPLIDTNADGIINARDLAELSKKFK